MTVTAVQLETQYYTLGAGSIEIPYEGHYQPLGCAITFGATIPAAIQGVLAYDSNDNFIVTATSMTSTTLAGEYQIITAATTAGGTTVNSAAMVFKFTILDQCVKPQIVFSTEQLPQ